MGVWSIEIILTVDFYYFYGMVLWLGVCMVWLVGVCMVWWVGGLLCVCMRSWFGG